MFSDWWKVYLATRAARNQRKTARPVSHHFPSGSKSRKQAGRSAAAMPKNKGKGGKNRRRGKNDNEENKRELEFKEDGQGACCYLDRERRGTFLGSFMPPK